LLAFLGDAAKAAAAALARALLGDGGDPRRPELVERSAGDATVFPVGHAWARLDAHSAARALPLVVAAVGSPLLRASVVSKRLLLDLGLVLRGASAFREGFDEGAYPTYAAIFASLPPLLDALVSRDAALLLPYARSIAPAPDGLLVGVLSLVTARGSRDLRLAAAQLLRHTLAPLLTAAPSRDDPNVLRFLAKSLPATCAELLSSPPGGEGAVETECILRVLIETRPHWPPAAAGAIADDARLRAALTKCANARSSQSPALVLLANQLLRLLHR
jgi:hypothetical protein